MRVGFEEENPDSVKQLKQTKKNQMITVEDPTISNNNKICKNIVNVNKQKKMPNLQGQKSIDLKSSSNQNNTSSKRNLMFSNLFLQNLKSITNNGDPKFNPPIKKIVKKKKQIVVSKTNKNVVEVKDDEKKEIEKEKASKKDVDNFGIIKIDLNESMEDYFPKESNRTLRNYTYNEAIKYENRNICQILYIFLLNKQIIFHTFLERSPLVPFHIKIGLFIFMLSFDIFLNALLYSNSNISKKYHTSKGLFEFTMSNNTLIIIISTFVSLVFFEILIKLSKVDSSIRKVFRKEEAKLKKNKNYVVDYPTKIRVFSEVESILKKYRIKLIIMLCFEFVVLLFFWYFVTAFCQVYSHTQVSLILNCVISIIIRFVIEALFCLLFAKLYTIAAHIDYICFYKFMLFIYDFSW